MKRLSWIAVLLLTACAIPFTLVEPVRQSAAGLSVEPGMRWNAVGLQQWEGRIAVWTQDGPTLNTLLFVGGTADGEPLFTIRPGNDGAATRQEAPPVFRRTMTSLEVAELFQATLARNFRTTLVEIGTVTPTRFLGQQGFRFGTRYTGRDEVERDGTFVGAVRDGRLYAIWLSGARVNYYRRYLQEFERIVESARLAG